MNPTTHSTRRQLGKYPIEASSTDNPDEVSITDIRNPVFYRDLHRYISRYWKCHITAAQYAVLDMIFDRTIGWGKLWEWISLNQFIEGVWNERAVYSDGTGLAKRTVQRALNDLVAKNIVQKRGMRGNASQFSINLLWHPPAYQYPDSKTSLRPAGSEEYWNNVADGKSALTFVLIQRKGAEIYEHHFTEAGMEIDDQPLIAPSPFPASAACSQEPQRCAD